MSVQIDITTDYLYTLTEPINANPFTISCWFFSQYSATTYSQVIAALDIPTESGYKILGAVECSGAATGDPVRAYCYNGSSFGTASTSTSVSNNQWIHLCGVFNTTADRRAYHNGGGKGTNTDNIVGACTELIISGRRRDNRIGAIVGVAYVAEVAVWDTALSDAEVAQLAAGVSPIDIQTGNLKAYWPLTQATTNTDQIGNNDLTEVDGEGGSLVYSASHPTISESEAGNISATISISSGMSADLKYRAWRRILTEYMPTYEGNIKNFKVNDLAASRLVASDANKKLTSVSALSGWIAGTENEINVADDGDGSITIGIVDPLIVGKGGTGRATSTTAYGLIAAGTTATGALQTLPAGATTEILVGGGASALPSWGTDIPTAVTIGSAYIYRVGGTDVSVSDGGTGASTLTDGGILLGSGTGAVTALAQATNGQLPIGSTGADPVLATLTGTANQVNIANGAGTITLSLPQDIHTSATPTFGALTLSGSATYGIDLSSGTWSSAVMNWDADPEIYANGTRYLSFDVTNANIVIGSGAGAAISVGDAQYNQLIGDGSGAALTTGDNNFFAGYQSGYKQTTSSGDIIIGYQAGYNNAGDPTLGSNIIIGYQSFYNDNGQYNVGLGYQSGYYNDTTGAASQGKDNVYIGYQSGYGVSGPGTPNTGRFNVGIGWRTLYSCTSGYWNFALGFSALYGLKSGNDNVALGVYSLTNAIDTQYCVAIGNYAMYKNTSDNSNVAIGYGALYTLNGGEFNNAIGYQTGYSGTTCSDSIFIGYQAAYFVTSGDNNCFIGKFSGAWNQQGSGNTAIGHQTCGYGALAVQTSLAYNTCIGYRSGYDLANGANYNTLIGADSGFNVNTGNNNCFIGYQSGHSGTTLASSILIGYKAGYYQTTAALSSNRLVIDNQDRTNITNEANQAILYGTMAATPEAQTLAINAAVTLGNLEDGHYTQIEADGTVEFNGNATVWNDANVGAAMLTLPAASQPDEDEFVDEGGGDTGITTWAYAIGEKSSGSIEIPHDYKEGSDIYFHIHWQGIAAPADGTDNVNWQLTYTVGQTNETLDAATTITKEIAIDTQYDFKLTDFAAITGTNFNIGDQFVFSIERIAASADDYAGDCLVSTVGLHYECDTCGSRQMTTKA